MSILTAIRAFKNEFFIPANEKRAINYKDVFPEIFGAVTSAGVSVTELNSMTIPAVYACVRLLSETLASIPLILYKRRPEGGKSRAQDHLLYKLLHDQPNEFMTSFTYRELMMVHLLLWGNSYSEIQRNEAGDPIALWPLSPSDTYPEINEKKSLVYKTVINGKGFILPKENILHIPGLGFNGLIGKSVIKFAAESLALGKAIEKFGNSFFGKGANPSGILKTEKKLDADERNRVRQAWNEAQQGLDKAFQVAVLDKELNWQAMGISPEDAQALETRKYSRSEIASIFRVPPHLIGDLDKATFSNIEQLSIEYVVYSIRPWCVRIEQAIHSKLFFDDEKSIYFSEFLIDGLLRGDSATRAASFNIMRQNGTINADEWRELENMNPIEDGSGKIYLVNGNMINPVVSAVAQKPARMLLPIAQNIYERIRSREDRDIERFAKKKEFQNNFRGIEEILDSIYNDSWVEDMLTPLLIAASSATGRDYDPTKISESIQAKTKQAIKKSQTLDEFRENFKKVREANCEQIFEFIREDSNG